jgi:hypothetical protein
MILVPSMQRGQAFRECEASRELKSDIGWGAFEGVRGFCRKSEE